jgi:hypothetical protein
VPSISSKHHGQGGQPNGTEEERPFHNVEAKEPCLRGFALIENMWRSFNPNNGSRVVSLPSAGWRKVREE